MKNVTHVKNVAVETNLTVLLPLMLEVWADDWAVEKVTEVYATIKKPDGMKLEFFILQHRQKVEVNYLYPRTVDGAVASTLLDRGIPRATYSLLRRPEDIAADIRKYLLPECESFHVEALAALVPVNARIEAMKDLRNEFAQAIGVSQIDSHSYSFRRTVNNVNISVQINTPDSIDLNLRHLTAEKARQIIQLLNKTAT